MVRLVGCYYLAGFEPATNGLPLLGLHVLYGNMDRLSCARRGDDGDQQRTDRLPNDIEC